MPSTPTRRLARLADTAATRACADVDHVTDPSRRTVLLDEAIAADDAAVRALAAVHGADLATLESHVRAARAHADRVRRLASVA